MWQLKKLLVFGAVMAGILFCGCPKKGSVHRGTNPANTRAQLLAGVQADTLALFISDKRIWVGGSAAVKLRKGLLTEGQVNDGVHSGLFTAIEQEAKGKSPAYRRVVIYSMEGVPRETLKVLRETVKRARIGPGIILPWSLSSVQKVMAKARKTSSSPKFAPPKAPKSARGYPVVLAANALGVWLNGELVGKLLDGRIPPRGASQNVSEFEIPKLERRFKESLKSLEVSDWKMLFVVTPAVNADVVQRFIQAAGLAGITKYKIERVLER
jgi:hypothetical protein